MSEPWLRPSGDGAILVLHIQPGAKRSEIAGVHGEALKIRLAAPPVDGKANAALLEFLAAALAIAKSRLTLVAGQTSRSKRVAVHGLAVAEIRSRLLPSANP